MKRSLQSVARRFDAVSPRGRACLAAAVLAAMAGLAWCGAVGLHDPHRLAEASAASVQGQRLASMAELDVRGAHLGPHCWPAAIKMLEAGLLPMDEICTDQFALKDFQAALDLVADTAGASVKVSILPGGTDTPMGRAVAATPEAKAFVEGLHALKRIAEPEEIARSVLHLASGASSFMTGAALLVDGGVSISRT